MTITVEEYTFHMIDMFITSQGVLMNILLLLLIYFCTPKTIGAYSVLIINAALVDLVIALCGLLTSIRFIPCDFTILIVSYGVCGRLGREFCFLLFKIQIHAIIHGMMSQLLSFAYRYYALIGVRIPSKRRIALICFGVYIPTLIVLKMD
ncbi:unnamed protein product [Caenorhabditis auriculariae]|uniref:G-protein coupled receptors family 1 profile domain-containing protein n=1 Tax=Caenorhabditis auriculariae TaxID=2777116 RepID=A0A8S1HB00_9PELO|nr:unnamed protein product [Caenorhabditis auriculariae]